jgi:hypothetical protein
LSGLFSLLQGLLQALQERNLFVKFSTLYGIVEIFQEFQ